MAICASMVSSPRVPSFFPVGSRTYTSDGENGKSSKKADSGGYPGGQAAREGVTKWASLVIGCGVSQSLNSLHAAMHWWFTASDHEVKIMLVVKLDRQTETMIVEQFVENPDSQQLETVLKQTITIMLVPNSIPARHSVTTGGADVGALVLDFNLLYRRAPGSQLGPNERDVVVSEADLEQIAWEVWNGGDWWIYGFMDRKWTVKAVRIWRG